jgi:hypothetical protein
MDAEMAKKRHKPEEIVAKLRQVEVLTSQGKSIAEAVKTISVTETTYFRWRAEYGGLNCRPSCANMTKSPRRPRAKASITPVIFSASPSSNSSIAKGAWLSGVSAPRIFRR